MTPLKTILTAVVTSVICFAVLCFFFCPKAMTGEKTGTSSVATAEPKESAYDRVIRTRTLRCGYALWPGNMEKDPNTGKMSGMFVDYMAEMGKLMDLKIEWTAEVGWGDFAEALRIGRVDAICSGIWTNAQRGMVLDFTLPIFYQGIVAFTKTGDTRFDNNLSAINHPDIRISSIEGSSDAVIAATFYPKAKMVSLPQLTESSQMLLNVTAGKADVAFTDRYTAGQFMESNPDTLHEVAATYPLSLFGNTLGVAKGEDRLKTSLDNATLQLLNTGVIEGIIQKYETYPNAIYRANLPYINN